MQHAGPSLPIRLGFSAMATSTDGGGVILFGGWNANIRVEEDTLLELRYDSDEWTPLAEMLKLPRVSHVVIPIP